MSNKLYELIHSAISSAKDELGDRSKYVGSSDLGCPLKTYFQKINLKLCLNYLF